MKPSISYIRLMIPVNKVRFVINTIIIILEYRIKVYI